MTLFAPSEPLAERMRPTTLDEVVGQRHLVGPGKPLRVMLERAQPSSVLLWGPPGCGKTTVARLLARLSNADFHALSAVSAGVKDVRALVDVASANKNLGKRTLLFLDEIHRFNKSQQDALLPHVESGLLVFVGATTENPSFEVNPALRSRARILKLEPIQASDIEALLQRALKDPRGLQNVVVQPEAISVLAVAADGDARRALTALEVAANAAPSDATGGRVVDTDMVREALGAQVAHMDKGGEVFYDLISALHKSVRASHSDGALYYLARMLAGGADLLYVARRVVRMASEDVGLADPNALKLCVAAAQACEFLGSPEGELCLAEAVLYLALAPKSNSVYVAFKAAMERAQNDNGHSVPLHLRNAPTGYMKSIGYGVGYAYYFDDPEGSYRQTYLPEALRGTRFYEATGEGWEEKVRARLAALREKHQG